MMRFVFKVVDDIQRRRPNRFPLSNDHVIDIDDGLIVKTKVLLSVRNGVT